MKNTKQIIFISIMIIIALTLTILITISTASVGNTAILGWAVPGEDMVNEDGNVVSGATNMMESFSYFCAHRGTKLGERGNAWEFTQLAEIVIKGNKATMTAIGMNGGSSVTEAYTDTSNTNLAMALLYHEISYGKYSSERFRTVDNSEKCADCGTYHDYSYEFSCDVGQVAMWYMLGDWSSAVLSNFNGGSSAWSTVIGNFQTDHSGGHFGARKRGPEIYSEVKSQVSGMTSPNSNGIEEAYYTGSLANKEVNITTDGVESGYAVIGPFKYNFVGDIENERPTLIFITDSGSKTINNYEIGKYTGGNFTTTNKIVSKNEFYIKVDIEKLDGVTEIKLKFQIEGLNLNDTTTTVEFWQRNDTAQPIISISQSGGKYNPKEFIYKIARKIDVTIKKVDEDGNPMADVTLQIKDSQGKIIAYITTDSEGIGVPTTTLITNQEYTLIETSNQQYGYKGCLLTADIPGATIIERKDRSIKFKLNFNCDEEITIIAKNKKVLTDVEIQKVGSNGEILSGVPFVIEVHTKSEGGTNYYAYLALYDESGNFIPEVTGAITINENNIATGSTYKVVNQHVGDDLRYNAESNRAQIENQATKFITDSTGTITIKNLEKYATASCLYDYTAYETDNNNYGYGSKENIGKNGSTDGSSIITIANEGGLGNLVLEKQDKDHSNILLSNVGFILEIGEGKYIQLESTAGIVTAIRGNATINKQNIAQGSEYKVNYVSSKSEATEFITDLNGKFTIENLEVYSPETGEKYTYKLIETSNTNYGYEITVNVNEITVEGIELNSGTSTTVTPGNPQKYTKISGYVWLENSSDKTNTYDCVYTNGGTDKKLTDIYSTDGNVTLNTNAKIPVEIKLCDKSGNIIKSKPDEFDATGKYTFNDIDVSSLSNYQVVFVYDGFYYVTVTENLDKDNGSKVADVQSERLNLNNKFATVKDNSQVVGKDGTVNNVVYNKEGHISTLAKLEFDSVITANTSTSGYNLYDAFNKVKAQSTTAVQCLDNVNMGIVLREQPKLSINSDIYSVLVGFDGYNYNYKYNGRQNYYENKNGDGIGVKFEQEYVAQRYTRTVYASDVEAAKAEDRAMSVEVTYKLQIANESSTLKIMPKQLINYFDSRYTIKAVGISYDESNYTTVQSLEFSTAQVVTGHSEYKSTIINFNEQVEATNSGTAGKGNVKQIYITFTLDESAIIDLLNQKSTFHNATEILSYTSYYGDSTANNTTDKTSEGNIYAGIDKMSQPGNMEISLIAHPSGGTDILDTTYYEDDTTSAPSLILEKSEIRMISGIIWEDKDANTSDNEKLGDGKYNETTEKPIANVKVSLHKVNSDGSIDVNVATYSDGTLAETITTETGEYKFGNSATNAGIIPGKYVIKYTYNNKSYIVGGNKINVNDYKSTIITSSNVKEAFESSNPNERWFVVDTERFSDARDDINLRNKNDIVKSSTYKENALEDYTMDAYTPVMNIGIEFTLEDEADALTMKFEHEFKNIDFGIIERPDTDVTIKKEITSLEILAQNGASIIPKGDPSDPNSVMQGVKTGLIDEINRKHIVPVEIQTNLLQGAQLNIEYTISVEKNCQIDYKEDEYYYYGTGGRTEKIVQINKVVDYLDNTMSLDATLNSDVWKEITVEELQAQGLISDQEDNNISSVLKDGNHKILYTEKFKETDEVKLYATKYLAVSDDISEANSVEIIEMSGSRTIKDAIPGNYNPKSGSPSEKDNFSAELQVTPPTGATVNYILYIISAIATATILVIGIVIIKKKIIK